MFKHRTPTETGWYWARFSHWPEDCPSYVIPVFCEPGIPEPYVNGTPYVGIPWSLWVYANRNQNGQHNNKALISGPIREPKRPPAKKG